MIDQLAFAEFLTKGEFDRHLRSMRPVYRQRRDVLLEAMAAASCRSWSRSGSPRGSTSSAGCRQSSPSPRSSTRRPSEAGLILEGLGKYRVAIDREAIIIGYAKLDEDTIREGVAKLRDAIAAVQSSRSRGRVGSGALLPAS